MAQGRDALGLQDGRCLGGMEGGCAIPLRPGKARASPSCCPDLVP